MSDWLWHMEGVFRKGMEARLQGKPCEPPYQNRIRGLNRLRADQWKAGWKMQDAELLRKTGTAPWRNNV